MIDGVNDSDEQADLLAKYLRGTPGQVKFDSSQRCAREQTEAQPTGRRLPKAFESHGITVTVRRKLGGDIDASCGQLRRKTLHLKEG